MSGNKILLLIQKIVAEGTEQKIFKKEDPQKF